jgi:ubiquinone/menaquinone biosynthesis C-methylase UbiE
MVIAEDSYRLLLLNEVTSDTEWLDLGCGWQLLRDWLPNGKADQVTLCRRARRLVGIDSAPRDIGQNRYLHHGVVGDILTLPFPDASFNLVTAQMVVEHLQRPLNFLSEVKRVLQPGGKFIFVTPNYLNYQVFIASLVPDRSKKSIVRYLERREESDVFKAYYRMNTRHGVNKMAQQSGFSVEAIHMAHADWEFRRFPPLHWMEKGLYRILDVELFSRFRSDILAVLSKPTPIRAI